VDVELAEVVMKVRVWMVLLALGSTVGTCGAQVFPKLPTKVALHQTATTWWPSPGSGLMWTGTGYGWVTYAEAEQYCLALRLEAPSGGWRLPTEAELDGILNGESISGPTAYHHDKGDPPGRSTEDLIQPAPTTFQYPVWSNYGRGPIIFGSSASYQHVWTSSVGKDGVSRSTMMIGEVMMRANRDLNPTTSRGNYAFCVREMDPAMRADLGHRFLPLALASEAEFHAWADVTAAEAELGGPKYPSWAAPAVVDADSEQGKAARDAEDRLKRAVVAIPKTFRLLKDLAYAQCELGEWPDAVVTLKAARKLNKDDGDVRVALGVAQAKAR
jgi:hypothetical protein